MKLKRITEKELLAGLNPYTSHADELAKPLPSEISPLERLKGTGTRYDQPTDPVGDEFFESEEGVTDDFMEDRYQPSSDERD